METPEIRVRCHCRNGRPATVVHRVSPIQSSGVQADSHTGTAATPPATDRCLPDYIVRAAHSQAGDAFRLLTGQRYPITGRAGCHQICVRRPCVHTIVARGPETSAGVLVRGHGAVFHLGWGHLQWPRRNHRPVVTVRRHAVRFQQFRRRSRVPVDDDM